MIHWTIACQASLSNYTWHFTAKGSQHMSWIRTHMRRHLAVLTILVAFAIGAAGASLLLMYYPGRTSVQKVSRDEIASLMKCGMLNIAHIYNVRNVSVYCHTDFASIDRHLAGHVRELVQRLGHQIPSGWEALLASANLESELLPDDFFASSSTQLVQVTVTQSLSHPNDIPTNGCELIVSVPIVVAGEQELLGIMWYSFGGVHGGGTGVVVCSQAADSAEWVVVHDNPIGVY